MASNYESRKKALERRRKLTETLMERGVAGPQAQGQMIGPHYLAPGLGAALAPALNVLAAGFMGKKLDKEEGALEQERNQQLAQAMAGIQEKVKSGDQSWMFDPMVLGDKTLSGYSTAAFKEQVKPRELGRYENQLFDPITGEVKKALPKEKKLSAHRGAIWDPSTGEVVKSGVGYAPASTNVTVNNAAPTAEKALSKTLGTGQGEAILEARKTKLDAVNTTRMLNRLEELDKNPVISGPQAGPLIWLGQAAAGFGIPIDTQRLANSEAYQQTIGESIARKVLEGGRGISNEDRAFIEKSYPSLMMTSQGRKAVIEHMRFVAQEQVRQADLMEQSLQGNFPELERLHNTNPSSQISLPPTNVSPQAAGRGTRASPGQPVVPQIQSDEEYDALPSGAEFISPDGKRRRKP